jgi:cystathionine gamma-lyase
MMLVPPLPLIASIVQTLQNPPLVLVDTTFLSSFYITPLDPPLADVVLSSLSKYSSGHSDIILGSLTLSSPRAIKGLRFLQNALGAAASPRDAHLMIRSLKTLSVRMIRHGLNALRLAAWLSDRTEVEDVRYPGLITDDAFPLVEQLISRNAKRELEYLGWTFPYVKLPSSGSQNTLDATRSLGIPFGGMVTFRLKGATAEQTDVFVSNLRLITLAESLGGVESLVEVPAKMTHAVSNAPGLADGRGYRPPREKH